MEWLWWRETGPPLKRLYRKVDGAKHKRLQHPNWHESSPKSHVGLETTLTTFNYSNDVIRIMKNSPTFQLASYIRSLLCSQLLYTRPMIRVNDNAWWPISVASTQLWATKGQNDLALKTSATDARVSRLQRWAPRFGLAQKWRPQDCIVSIVVTMSKTKTDVNR